MDERCSATIIPFPIRKRADLEQSTERLADALASLSVALTRQRDATQKWRDALNKLSEQAGRTSAGHP